MCWGYGGGVEWFRIKVGCGIGWGYGGSVEWVRINLGECRMG